MSVYDPLRDYLKRQDFRELELSFAQLEEIICRPLPHSAERPQWWANTVAPGRPQREAWRAAGDDAFLIAGSRKVRFERRSGQFIEPTAATAVARSEKPIIYWDPDALINDFRIAAHLAGVELGEDAITVESLPASRAPPTGLPVGKMAVYVFSRGSKILKVGRFGAKSHARHPSQRYNPTSTMSTLVASILADRERNGLGHLDEPSIRDWIKEHIYSAAICPTSSGRAARSSMLSAFGLIGRAKSE
jgi:hypothetical protein